MSDNFNSPITEDTTNVWLTPPYIIKALGTFHLDPCAPLIVPPDWRGLFMKTYNAQTDGLAQDWIGRVWCNPPYGRETSAWLKKLKEHGDGIALIFARTDTANFHKYIFDGASSIFFFEKRIKFARACGTYDQGANAPSCLVAYGKNNVRAIDRSGLSGCHLDIEENN